MWQHVDDDMLNKYIQGNLSVVEQRYVEDQLNQSEELRERLIKIQEEAPKEESSAPEKQQKRFAPPKWMTTLMIVGWGILLVAVVIVLMDVTEKMEDYEREQAPHELAPKDTSGSHQRD